MNCEKCGNAVDNGAQFCKNCGAPIKGTKKAKIKINVDLTEKQKKITICLLIVIIILLGITAFMPGGNNKRTIMIYVVGSNLETNSSIVTADLDSIDIKKVNLKNTNVLLYTGGTEKWHNFISNEDNGIYILKSNGFVKLKSEEQYNLGDPKTLSNFLKYAYTNYKAKKYDLVLYDHGGAIDGAIYDDISNDNLSLADMTEALKNSPFSSSNKLEAVLFRTCLNGTIELANIFYPYAKYLIGSEEVSYGSPYTSVLNFINDLELNDTGKEFGIKFVKAYDTQMKRLAPLDEITHTYSVIDLSKIPTVNKLLNDYMSGFNVQTSYNSLSKIRANTYQYGMDAETYDMIDLYEFVKETKDYSTSDNQKLLKAIKDAVVYNNTNNETSNGLSIYFPYKGGTGMRNKFLSVYGNLDYSDKYAEFITQFNAMKSKPSSFSFNIESNKVEKVDPTKRLSLELTEEQVENYAYSIFGILERDEEHPNYYRPILSTDDVTLNDNNILTANYENSLITAVIDKTGEDYYIFSAFRKNKNNSRELSAILYDNDKDFLDDGYMISANIYIGKSEEGKPKLSLTKINSNNERIDGNVIDINEYERYSIVASTYRILDENGKVIDATEWEPAPVRNLIEGDVEELQNGLKYSSLPNKDNLYAVFIIHDVNDNVVYSKLIKVGE